MVQRETIERICANVADLPEATLEGEFERFFEAQETICDFLMDSLNDASQRARELGLYLSYVAFKGMSLDSGLSTPVDAGTILRAGDASRAWLDHMAAYAWAPEPERTEAAAPGSAAGDEPYLLGFVAAEIEDAGDGPIPFDDDEKGALMFTLKTVIASMTETSREKEPGP
jgi:hypothetical protein